MASHALSRLYPFAQKAYRTSRSAWEHWQSLPPHEQEHYKDLVRQGFTRIRGGKIARNSK
jgi:hypothetical protein